MKKNILLFVFIVLCCTGCHVDYHLNIDTVNSMEENIILNGTSNDDIKKINSFNEFVPIDIIADDYSAFQKKLDGIDYYSILRKDNSLNFIYDRFNVKKLNDSMFARSCYQYVTVMEGGRGKSSELLLSTSNKFLCFDRYDNLDDVTVTITSKYKLKKTNADVVDEHKYTWNINKENANDKYLYLLLDTTVRELSLWDRIMEGEYTNVFTVSLVIAFIGGIVYLILKKKGDRRNRI